MGDWFQHRSSDWRDWALADLLEAKRRRGIRISLVVPAYNEAGTVGAIVSRLRRDLMESAPLVDEIIVIDSDSTDSTSEEAHAAGANVYLAAEIRPDLGIRRGKGEAMWKSLFVTRGDVLVFIDADLTEWDSHFVTGLLGPLLLEPDVQLVKGFYDRPLIPDGRPEQAGSLLEGGRVTELMARPLLALRWPELGVVVQPLSGEWAIRRELFEQLAVPTGYGVEMGVLVDTYLHGGLEAIAQVDLGRRVHGHQSLRDLGAMALEILAIADRRSGGLRSSEQTVRLLQYNPGDHGSIPVRRDVVIDERPSARSVLRHDDQSAVEKPDRGLSGC